MKFLLVSVVLFVFALAIACLGMPPPPVSVAPLTPSDDPIAMVTTGLQQAAQAINDVTADGQVTSDETHTLQVALTDMGQTMVKATRQIETNLRAQITQAQTSGTGVDWPATLLQVAVSAVTGGLFGFQLVRKAPNRMILGTEPDPDVARAAGHPPIPPTS